jgi:hypothetical protein
MTQAPQQEVEVQGRVGQAVALPLTNDGTTAYVWTLELPEHVEGAGTSADGGGLLLVRATAPGSHVLTATLAQPSASTPITVLLIRLTVS